MHRIHRGAGSQTASPYQVGWGNSEAYDTCLSHHPLRRGVPDERVLCRVLREGVEEKA